MSGAYPVCARCGVRLFAGEYHQPRFVAVFDPMPSFPPPADYDFASKVVERKIDGCIIRKEGFDPVHVPAKGP